MQLDKDLAQSKGMKLYLWHRRHYSWCTWSSKSICAV